MLLKLRTLYDLHKNYLENIFCYALENVLYIWKGKLLF